LKEALQDIGNWQPEIPDQLNMLVTTKDLSQLSDQIFVHPFGLVISQKIVPLDMTIDKYGNDHPADFNKFQITKITSGYGAEKEDLDVIEAREQFAPAQYIEMSDSDRIASRSFEKLKSGIRIRAAEQMKSSHSIKRDVEYERIIIDCAGRRDKGVTYTVTDQTLEPLKTEHLPDEVLTLLEEIKNQSIKFKKIFLSKLKSTIGTVYFNKYHLLILKHTEKDNKEDDVVFKALLNANATARCQLSYARVARSPLAPAPISVVQENYAVVNTNNLTLFNGYSTTISQAEAVSLMSDLIRKNPALEDEIQVIPDYEVNRV